jgi:NADPH-dependent 2,4-dienoyl-CoA reductase/sulfur reductase-like enzyme
VHTLRTLADAIRLRDVLPARPRVVLVGAGFIGCEVAATLRGHDLAVSMIDIASHPMPQLGPEIGARAAQLHAGHGVDLHLGVSVESFEGHDRVEAVRLSDGRRLEADVVLVGLGAQPNTEWLEGSGLRLRAGAVLCDEHCLAVGTTDVVAAGDVAAWPYPTAGAVLRVEHWTNGAEMAMRAATNLLAAPHERTPHAPVFTFWSDQYDVKIRVAGLPGRAASLSVVQADPDRGLLVVEGRREGRLVGAVTFNSSRDHLRHCRELAAAAA